MALLANARRHAAGSPVDLRAETIGDDVMFYVEDRGPGMSLGLRERAFQRRVCGSESAGSGLGLFIVHQLMADQGGAITVEARPGGGTSFLLRFCAAPAR